MQAYEKKKGKLTHPAEPRFIPFTGTEDELQKYFLENKMTDGLPIVLPTEDRVLKMLKGTDLKPNKIVNKRFTLGIGSNGQLEGRNITVEKVAIVSVMAGANPEYFPVILALASYGPPFSSSAQSFTGMAVVHGPIAKKIGMNSEFGALGPYNHANATIGRAWQLMARNFAFADPGTTLLGTWGNNLQYNCLTFAENQHEQIPSGWSSFHVEKGFKKKDNVISIWSGRGFRQRVGHDIPSLTLKTLENVTFGGALVLLPSVSARIPSEDYGFRKKKDFRQFLYENSFAKIKEWRSTDLVQTFHIPGVEIGWSPQIVNKYMKLNNEDLVKRFYSPSQINIMIVGSGAIFFTQGGDFELKKMVAIDAWN